MTYHNKQLNYDLVRKSDSECGFQSVSRQVASASRPFRDARDPRRSGPSRMRHQNARSDIYRKGASQVTENDLSIEMKNKLFSGIKDGQLASERL